MIALSLKMSMLANHGAACNILPESYFKLTSLILSTVANTRFPKEADQITNHIMNLVNNVT